MATRKEKGHYGRPYLRMRSEIFAAESACWLCGEWVDQTLNWRDDGAPQLHMVVPLTRGGSWRDKRNCHLAHRACNLRQGNKEDGSVRHALPAQESWIVGETP